MNAPPAGEPSRRVALALLALCVAASLVTSALAIAHEPTLYWLDGYDRLAHRGDLLVWRWLPLLQSILLVASALLPDVESVRGVLALIAAATVAAAYAFGARVFGRGAGLVAAALVAGNPLLVVFATVPYQEALYLLQLFAIFAIVHRPAAPGELQPLPARGRLVLLALLVSLACLNRYEGWLLLPIVALEVLLRAWRQIGWPRALARGLWVSLAFGGLLALGWLVFLGVEVTEREASNAARLDPAAMFGVLSRILGQLAREGFGVVLVMGIWGALLALGERAARVTHLRVLAYLALHLGLLFATDVLGPQRLAFPFMLFCALYAGHGCAWTARALALRLPAAWGRPVAHTALALGVLGVVALGAVRGLELVRRNSNSNAELLRAQRTATWLRDRLDERSSVVVASELQRRGICVHAWIPLGRVVDGSLLEGDVSEQLAALAAQSGRLFALPGESPGGELEGALERLEARAEQLGVEVEREPSEELPPGSDRVWSVRAR